MSTPASVELSAAPPAESDLRRAQGAFAALLLGPVALLLALTYHPWIPNLTDNAAVAEALQADPTRWGFAHLAVGVAAALLLLGFLVLRGQLAARGDRWSTRGVPFVVVGTVFFAFLPAMEVAIIAVDRTGGDVEAAMDQMDTWFVPFVFASAITFAIGMACFAVAVLRTPLGLGRPAVLAVVGALALGALARFAPLTPALYVSTISLIVAMWLLGVAILRQAELAAEETAGRTL